MFKKMILVAVVGGLAVAAFKGTRMASYVRNEIKSIREAAEDQIAPDQEIARLRGEVKLLDDDGLKLVKQLARLQSDQADLTARQKTLEANRKAAATRKDTLATEAKAAEDKAKAGEQQVAVVFETSRYSLDTAKQKLKDMVLTEKNLAKELTMVAGKIDGQQRIIDKLEQQRLAMGRLKADLEFAIDKLEVEYQDVKLQQMESKVQTDDTRAAQIKAGIAELSKKFDIQRRTLTMLQDGQTPAGVPVVAETVEEILADGKVKAAGSNKE
ncbi:MAG: hypothetical protein K2X82_19480 [Gemmataceae bacterium]|nr:hypothetical protein [Gemmataceae bacterium]